MLVPVGCWAFIGGASQRLDFNVDASLMLDFNADASQMPDFSRK